VACGHEVWFQTVLPFQSSHKQPVNFQLLLKGCQISPVEPDVTILSSSLLHCQLSSPNATTLHKKWRADKQAGPKPLHQLWIAPFPLLKWKPITVPSRYRRRSWAGAYLQFCTTNCAGSSGQSCTSHGAGASKDGKGGKRAVPPAGSPRSYYLLCPPLQIIQEAGGQM